MLLLVVLLLALLVPASAEAATAHSCAGDPAKVRRIDMTIKGQRTYGHYVEPSLPPLTLVVFAHGFTHTVFSWDNHMRRHARRDGVLAVAMNYRGTRDIPDSPDDPDTLPSSRGYPVKPGSEDLIIGARRFLALCPSVRNVVLVGISLGGNVSGIAAAAQAKRPDGKPLFDYWIGVEGAYNVTELYQEARPVAASGDEFAGWFVEDMEKEAGGTFEQVPDAYFERTVVRRTDDILASRLKGVTLVHGIEDGLVSYNQSPELTRLLRDGDLPTDFYTVTSRRPGDDPDTALAGYAPGDCCTTGNAGHGSEPSENHIVIDTGFNRLSALVSSGDPRPCNRDFTVQGSPTETTSPDPSAAAPGCPRVRPLGRCRDATRPVATLRARVRRGRLRLRGRASDRACGAPWRVKRVRVSIARRTRGGRCRFVRRSGRLSRVRSCRRPLRLRARGTRRWRLTVPRRLPVGRYRVTAVAVDGAGNRSRPVRRRPRLR